MVKNYLLLITFIMILGGCKGETPSNGKSNPNSSTPNYYSTDEFVMGVDLSYANQIMDHGGTYQDSGSVESPYKIVSDYGANVTRVRLWHHPDWVQEEVYQDQKVPLYSGLPDVKETIRKAKEQGMAVNLDFHYSDNWADPTKQRIPEAWKNITSLEVLKDSVYEYTKHTLQVLNNEGLMPEYVQIGNEINCGMLYSNAPAEFPALNVCEGNWSNLGGVIKSGIQAVREVSSNSDEDTKVILHIAQPENVEWWFDNISTSGGVSDFDIIGFSYYSPWSDVSLDEISDHVSNFRQRFDKEVMIVETAYSWTMQGDDNYTNRFGEDSLVEGYPATKEGQKDFMIALTQEVISGGGVGLMYWEPAWISSSMRDQWGTGSSWENNTFFDFEGNVHVGIDYMTYEYEFE